MKELRDAVLTVATAAAIGAWLGALGGAAVGAFVGLAAAAVLAWARRRSPAALLGAGAGALVGSITALVLKAILSQVRVGGQLRASSAELDVAIVLVVVSSVVVFARLGARAAAELATAKTRSDEERARPIEKLLDTSVIIDGRIAGIVAAGFLDGPLVIPGFVLRELQQVADSSDSGKRARGRRGLDILRELQDEHDVVTISDEDPSGIVEVDLKLIEVARGRTAKIVTNDFNLNKVASLHGIEILNINDLANAMRPVVQVGEGMRVHILREGKELTQGVGYLEDGTMVVVEGARRAIGSTVMAIVTSVHQSSAGKMIFCRHEVTSSRENGSAARATGDESERRESRKRWNRGAERMRGKTGG